MLREVSARPSPTAARDDEYRPLAAYFRELADENVMTREQETEAALHIAALRKNLWTTILQYAPFAAAIAELARHRMPAETCPHEQLLAVERTARTVRDRDLRRHHDAFAAARDALAETMLVADVDHELALIVIADLGRLVRDRGATISLNLRPPPRGSAPFLRYVAAVRRAHADLMAAKNAFVRSNLRLVVALARRFRRGSVSLQDLIQEGNIGLMKAVDRFDPHRGCRFSTYGAWWIRHAISRSIADKARSIRVPVHMQDACSKVDRARRELEAKLGREPTDDELAAASGVGIDRIEHMRWAILDTPLSLALPTSRDGETTLADTVPDDDHVAASELIDAATLQSQLKEVFANLSPLEADILRKRVGLGGEQELTLKEIGAGYSLSRERIRQLQEGALAKLRAEFSRRQLM